MLSKNISLFDKINNKSTNHLCLYTKDRNRINSYITNDPFINTESLQAINTELRYCIIKNWFKGDINSNQYEIGMSGSQWKIFQSVVNDKFTMKVLISKINQENNDENWNDIR